jgi:hypothetical protein
MPLADASDAPPLAFELWRAVEAQHVVSTMPLVDTLQEQRLLEELLDASKPAVPAAAVKLHYLLGTPFRYPSPWGSRFRRPTDPGALYGADEMRTACSELGYWRWRFLMDSPAMAHIDALPQTVFRFGARGATLDLTSDAWNARRSEWMHPSDYTACRDLGDLARRDGVMLIRYASVRDPQHATCCAVLHPGAVEPSAPLERESWYLQVHRDRVRWWRADGAPTMAAFDFDTLAWSASHPTRLGDDPDLTR